MDMLPERILNEPSISIPRFVRALHRERHDRVRDEREDRQAVQQLE